MNGSAIITNYLRVLCQSSAAEWYTVLLHCIILRNIYVHAQKLYTTVFCCESAWWVSHSIDPTLSQFLKCSITIVKTQHFVHICHRMPSTVSIKLEVFWEVLFPVLRKPGFNECSQDRAKRNVKPVLLLYWLQPKNGDFSTGRIFHPYKLMTPV